MEKLDVINGRMKSLETRQESLEKEVKKGYVSVQSSPALTPSGRKRQTPVALQVIGLFIQKGGTHTTSIRSGSWQVGSHLGISSWGRGRELTDHVALRPWRGDGSWGGSWVNLGGKLSCLGEKLPLRSPP